METRIGKAFQSSPSPTRGLLNIYCTAGFPQPDSTLTVMQALQDAGADMIELGMPYSDPLADGPVIQQSSQQAIANGMTIEKLFEQLQHFRQRIHLPVILMGYLNPVLQYGFDRFCRNAAAVGIDGLILPDLPIFEFESEYGAIIKKYGLDFIFLVTPETTAERIQKLEALTTGFLYAVSSSATTGKDTDIQQVERYLGRLQAMGLRNPLMAGFGIKDKASFDAVCQYTSGGIVGSAYIKALQNSEDIAATTAAFVQTLRGVNG